MNQSSMARALGLAPKARHIALGSGTVVLLSVRYAWGGLPRRYIVRVPTISALGAECEAKKQARADGYVVHAVLSVEAEER